ARQLFHFVAVRFPDSNRVRQVRKNSILIFNLNWTIPTLAECALVTFAGSDALNQINRRAIRQRDLLLAAADAQDRLRRVVNYLNNSGQRFPRVAVPRMTLAAQENMRRAEILNELRRDSFKPLRNDSGVRSQALKC